MSEGHTKAQAWFRRYSEHLQTGYKASALVTHPTTKGDARENQILDVLRSILPPRLTIVPHPVIVDSADRESRSFDAAITSAFDYPRLFAQGVVALMVEDVRSALEVKSNLDGQAVSDIFRKSASLRNLAPLEPQPDAPTGLTFGFAYECDNINLRFLDFAVASVKGGDAGVSAVCILNQGVFGLISSEDRLLIQPGTGAIPCFCKANEDSLLFFVYLLIRELSAPGREADHFREYSRALFHSLEPQTFDAGFLDAVISNDESLRRARESMRGMGGASFAEAYARARAAL